MSLLVRNAELGLLVKALTECVGEFDVHQLLTPLCDRVRDILFSKILTNIDDVPKLVEVLLSALEERFKRITPDFETNAQEFRCHISGRFMRVPVSVIYTDFLESDTKDALVLYRREQILKLQLDIKEIKALAGHICERKELLEALAKFGLRDPPEEWPPCISWNHDLSSFREREEKWFLKFFEQVNPLLELSFEALDRSLAALPGPLPVRDRTQSLLDNVVTWGQEILGFQFELQAEGQKMRCLGFGEAALAFRRVVAKWYPKFAARPTLLPRFRAAFYESHERLERRFLDAQQKLQGFEQSGQELGRMTAMLSQANLSLQRRLEAKQKECSMLKEKLARRKEDGVEPRRGRQRFGQRSPRSPSSPSDLSERDLDVGVGDIQAYLHELAFPDSVIAKSAGVIRGILRKHGRGQNPQADQKVMDMVLRQCFPEMK